LIQAPPHWRVIDFISDLHMQAAEPQTFSAWRDYLQKTRADAVFILGDLFEVWIGDDAASVAPLGEASFEAECAVVLKNASRRLDLFFMRGNRDFLVGKQFCASNGVRFLDDPCVLQLPAERWVLSHGDALCLADLDYQQFRKTVRSVGWQSAFLAKSLTERRELARQLREQSQARQRVMTEYADADESAVLALLAQTGARHLLHGHTHRPASHLLAGGLRRHVLSDWDLQAQPPRAQVLRLTFPVAGAAEISRIAPTQA
jgi:UDP-2,3-diacylglucosamine hydrolase